MSRRNSGRAGGGSGSSAPAFTPMDTAPYIWLEADTGVTQSANRASAWLSKTNGVSLAQGTDANKPLYVSVDPDFNNLPIMQIDGATKTLAVTGQVLPFPFSSFEYGITDGSGAYNDLISSNTTGHVAALWNRSGANQNHTATNPGSSSSPGIADAANEKRSLYRGCAASGEVTLIRNAGTPTTGTAANAPVGQTNNLIGVGYGVTAQPSKKAAYLVFKRELTSAEVLQLHEYFDAKYGNTVAVSDDDIHALVPYSWMDADTYTVDGVSGKVASFPDKVAASTGIRASVPAHAYVQADSAKQVVVPTATASLGNELTADFALAPYYVSNGGVSDWKDPHDGTGFECFTVLDRTTVTGIQYTWATYTAATTGASLFTSTTTLGFRIYNGATNSDVTSSGEATGATYVDVKSATADTPDTELRRRSAILSSGSPASVDTGNATSPMTVGALPNGTSPLNAKVAMILFFDRVLTVNERAKVQAYARQRFGV